jgi:photosystem II stability/assembly factor-like uncharacterized protein
MRNSIIFFIWALLIACNADSYGASCIALVFEKLDDGLRDASFKQVLADANDSDHLVAVSGSSVYSSHDGGNKWSQIFSLRSEGIFVNTVDLSSGKIYCGTDDGLYTGIERGDRWKRIFGGIGRRENSVLSVAVTPAGGTMIFVGTRSGLFVSRDAGRNWNKVRGMPADLSVRKILYAGSVIYALTDRGLYRGYDNGSSWKISYGTVPVRENGYSGSGEDSLSGGVEPERGRSLTSLVAAPDDPDKLFMGTTSGLIVSEDGGRTWKVSRFAGITGAEVRALSSASDDMLTIFAATGNGLYCLDPASGKSLRLYKGLLTEDVRDVAVTVNPYGPVIVATGRGLYISYIDASAASYDSAVKTDSALWIFSGEPTIADVREAAIRYAEVDPRKIRKWRRAASNRAWLPDLHISFDRNRDWQSSTYFYSTSTQKYKDDDITKGKDYGWSVSLTWELGDLIWNDAQTSIDARSRLMVQLRDDIVNEVTRLYFERRRLQIKMLLRPERVRMKRIEDELRLQELTASIDALTGSYLSRRMRARVSSRQ